MQNFQNRLGGVLKIMEIFDAIPTPPPNPLLTRGGGNSSPLGEGEVRRGFEEVTNLSNYLKSLPASSKLTFGLNVYNQPELNLLKNLLPKIKKNLKASNISCRFVNKNFHNLETATTLGEKLINSGTELNLIFGKNEIYLSRTVSLQDIDGYSRRDYNKPARDGKMGMLPPKLAQIMINLAVSPSFTKEGVRGWSSPAKPLFLIPNPYLFDPFCGSGTILMEALLMGYNVIGSDINPIAVEYTTKNISWLRENFNISKNLTSHIFTKNAVELDESDFLKASPKTLEPYTPIPLITEPFLGPPLLREPKPEELSKIQTDLKKLYLDFFQNLKNILPTNTPIIIIFPYIKSKNQRHFLKITDDIEKFGFKAQDLIPQSIQENFKLGLSQFKSLLYERKDQTIGREIWKFIK